MKRRRQLPLRRQLTIRARLAVLNTAVFVTGAMILLGLNWFSVRQIIVSRGRTLSMPASQLVPTDAAPVEGGFVTPVTVPPEADPHGQGVADRFQVFQDAALQDLLARSLLAVLAIAIVSLLASWWVARRALVGLSALTAAARSIGDDTLHSRLALTGPHDEVKELADTFDAMLDRLERSFTDQRRFTAHASHELRTPLTVQRTALEIPLARGMVPPELEPDVRRALAAVGRSERLIGSLLALARGESGLLDPLPGDLADQARAALADVRLEADDAGVTVHAQLDPAPVVGDQALLPQLAGNMILNGIRHNHRGGRVRVMTGARDGRSYLEVTNTGPIVSAEELATLFEPFRRGADRLKGSGLGLPVIRTITQTHGGRLITIPDPAGGLRIRAELPSSPGTSDRLA